MCCDFGKQQKTFTILLYNSLRSNDALVCFCWVSHSLTVNKIRADSSKKKEKKIENLKKCIDFFEIFFNAN